MLDPDFEIIRTLKTYYKVQKIRIAIGNQILVNKYTVCEKRHLVPLKKGESRNTCPRCGLPVKTVVFEPDEAVKILYDGLTAVEDALASRMKELVRNHPLWTEYLSHVKGVGAITAGFLISMLNPARFETVSRMWKYCGLHVVNGKAPHKVSGEKLDWSPFARTMMYRLGENFRKTGKFYKLMYKRFFEESLAKHPDWSKAHHLAHARRVTVKLFLAHYHFVGRIILGLEVRKPYICEQKPHHCIPPIVDDGTAGEFYDKYLLAHWDGSKSEYCSILHEMKIPCAI